MVGICDAVQAGPLGWSRGTCSLTQTSFRPSALSCNRQTTLVASSLSTFSLASLSTSTPALPQCLLLFSPLHHSLRPSLFGDGWNRHVRPGNREGDQRGRAKGSERMREEMQAGSRSLCERGSALATAEAEAHARLDPSRLGQQYARPSIHAETRLTRIIDRKARESRGPGAFPALRCAAHVCIITR